MGGQRGQVRVMGGTLGHVRVMGGRDGTAQPMTMNENSDKLNSGLVMSGGCQKRQRK